MSYNNGQQPLNVTATIESIEDKPSSIKIKAGGKSFSFFKTKRDGNETSPFAQFKNMGLKAGDTVAISYVVEDFTLQDGKQGHANKVIWFREAGGGAPAPEKPRYEAKNTSSDKSVDWDKLGYKKTLTNWVSQMVAATPVNEIKDFVTNEAWGLWQVIDAEGERRFGPVAQAALKANPNFFDKPEPVFQETPPIETYDDLASQVPF